MADFEPYFPKILQSEGTVYENDPTDNGGCTHFGIILEDIQTYFNDKSKNCEDVKALTESQAHDIYKKMYWDAFLADSINNQSLAEYIVDGGINQGKGTIAKYIQEIVGVTVDGIFGHGTLAAVNNHDAEDLFNQLKSKRIAHYNAIVANNPPQVKFLKGWINRANCIPFQA